MPQKEKCTGDYNTCNCAACEAEWRRQDEENFLQEKYKNHKPELYEHSCPHCADDTPKASEELSKSYTNNIKKKIDKFLKDVYNKSTNNEIFKITGKTLAEKTHNAYESITHDFSTPDVNMLARITADVWHFSAAKNFQELKDLTLLLKDDKGKLREWNDFKEVAGKVVEKYQTRWMRTEYNFTVSASQSAARWTEFEKDKNITNLEYQTVGDSSVRPAHRLLDGVIKPKNHSFWNTHYPPNGYGCRCEVISTPDGIGRVTPDNKLPYIEMPKMFRTNLAKTGLLFPKGHPYYEGIPKSELRKSIAWLDPKDTYKSYVIGNKEIDIHPLHGEKELSKNLDACNTLLIHESEAEIKLLPILYEKDEAVRDKFYPKDYIKKFPNKNADAIINGNVIEFELPNGSKSSIQNAIKHGKKQSDKIYIKLPDSISFEKSEEIVNGQMKHYVEKEDLTVYLYNEEQIKLFQTSKKRQ